jgi:hypothetical protein
MNKTLKWILYILLGLVVIAVVAGIVFAVFGGFGYGMMRPGIWVGDHMRFTNSPIRLIFGGLLCLGILLLVVLGIAALITAVVRGNRPAPPTSPTQIAAAEHPCPNCGRITQEDWKTCPYCGTPLT